jgi:hypothetical protein
MSCRKLTLFESIKKSLIANNKYLNMLSSSHYLLYHFLQGFDTTDRIYTIADLCVVCIKFSITAIIYTDKKCFIINKGTSNLCILSFNTSI